MCYNNIIKGEQNKLNERRLIKMATYYFDMDGVLANFHKEKYSFANASNREWIANLDPFMNNVNIVKSLIKSGNNVYILSKAATEQAKEGKVPF